MSANVTDRMLSKFAQYLESRDMKPLGRGYTTRLARRYNRLKYRRHELFREKLACENLGELLRENGFSATTPVTMQDGWAIDATGSFPHLDRLMKECSEIIEERAGKPSEDFGRPYFQSLTTVQDVHRYPSILDFATSSEVIGPLAEYCGFVPHLSQVLPRGYRLVESNRQLDPGADGPPRSSQLWHLDYHSSPTIYVIVALRDITPESGPLHYIGAALSQHAADKLNYWSRHTPFCLTDDVMYSVVDERDVHRFCAQAGTILFIDSNRCFHYGSRKAWPPRLQMQYSYMATCRTDFTGPLRRSDLQVYPVRESDSRLRKLILDHNYME